MKHWTSVTKNNTSSNNLWQQPLNNEVKWKFNSKLNRHSDSVNHINLEFLTLNMLLLVFLGNKKLLNLNWNTMHYISIYIQICCYWPKHKHKMNMLQLTFLFYMLFLRFTKKLGYFIKCFANKSTFKFSNWKVSNNSYIYKDFEVY